MPTWTVRTRSGVRPALTPYQLEALVGAGRVDLADTARADDAPPDAEWTPVAEIPAFERRLKAVAAAAPALDDTRIALLLSSDIDRRATRRLQRAAGLFKAIAALILCAEFLLFARLVLTTSHTP